MKLESLIALRLVKSTPGGEAAAHQFCSYLTVSIRLVLAALETYYQSDSIFY